ncbi:MAG: nuclease [Gemmatimonas sp.]|nr:nuclease [Gemmatimonas sp.]
MHRLLFDVAVESRTLRDKVRGGAQNRPGVYRMMGTKGVVIYVGKSKRLRTRLLGYFRAKRKEKAWRIIREAAAIDWEYTPSEFASLLRELELIKRFRPPYNVRQKRDGIYWFLKLSSGPAPRVQMVRRPNNEPGSYYGPLRAREGLADAVKELNDLLLLRDCRRGTPIRFADQGDLFGVDITPLCPRYELRRCAAPCAAKISERDYLDQVAEAKAFLQGDSEGPLRELERRMSEAVERLEFEHAALLRNRRQCLEMLRTEFLRAKSMIEQLSFLYVVPSEEGDHRIYAIRSGSVRAEFPVPRTAAERKQILAVADQHYRQPEPPGQIAFRRQVDQMLLVSHWFRTRPEQMEWAYPSESWSKLPLKSKLDRQVMA